MRQHHPVAALAAGFPDSVPGVTIDRQCGSSQQALSFAAQGVDRRRLRHRHRLRRRVDEPDPDRQPTRRATTRRPLGRRRYPGGLVPQGVTAELVARKWGLSRAQLDEFALRSHQRAAAAWREG